MIPGFDLGPVLGQGGASTVHQARQRSTGREVAVKIVEVDAAQPEAFRAFERERNILATLAAHPHVVSVLDAGVVEDRAWIAMEWYSRGSLAGGIARPGDEAVGTMAAVAAALEAAHARGVVHCDVKPANILLGDYGPALGDFGIARLGLGTGRTGAAYTLDHAAPEVVAGERPTPAPDVFSLGTTTWTLLSGRPPFRRADDVSAATVLLRLTHDPLPPLGHPDLDRLLAAMTAKDPMGRPSARALREAAENLRLPAAAEGLGLDVTDHRAESASLTRSGGSPRLAAAPMWVGDVVAQPGRDRVVTVAVAALVVIVLASVALLGARLGTSDLTTVAAVIPTTTGRATTTIVVPTGAPSRVPAASQAPPSAAGTVRQQSTARIAPTAATPVPVVAPAAVAAPPIVAPTPVITTTVTTTAPPITPTLPGISMG